MANFVTNCLQYLDLARKIGRLEVEVEKAAKILFKCLNEGGQIYIIGNGGSAADASHFAGELVGRFYKERRALPCICLNTDISIITAISNDYGYGAIFERQLEASFIPQTDVLITLSTSGSSENIIRAIEYITEHNGTIINLIGKDGGYICSHMELPNQTINIIVPSQDTPRIQEAHMFILHYFAEYIEEAFVNGV